MTFFSLATTRAFAAAAFVGALMLAAPAYADKAAGDACAGALSPDGQMIYAAAVGAVSGGAEVRGTVTDAAKSLVMSGKIARGDARSNAEAAGACLAKARP
ncbi:hypothetical protein [Ancylobacter pratisalsi]|uniref:Uncharacterized protein n=1 Tax=Ancylobacter pratisalsi TaxID=1745854 RepID=A0A6P1YHW3_9HYPH|nr:hypothetical protein [Ancylobacter pratisalsi]QIB32306.1 hypothetical protein G3A50_00245 [Ancylobacter pratisalsi]